MQTWEERVETDADAVFAHMVAEYQAGKRLPLSIAKLSSQLRRSRERTVAALVMLIFDRKTVQVVGDADNALFYPVDV